MSKSKDEVIFQSLTYDLKYSQGLFDYIKASTNAMNCANTIIFLYQNVEKQYSKIWRITGDNLVLK